LITFSRKRRRISYMGRLSALPCVEALFDVGYIESGLTENLEMIVIGKEIADMCLRIAKGVDVNDETLETDIINQVGPAANT